MNEKEKTQFDAWFSKVLKLAVQENLNFDDYVEEFKIYFKDGYSPREAINKEKNFLK